MWLSRWVVGLFHRPVVGDIAVSLPLRELKKRVKIVIVDDDQNSFPTESLKSDGYTVEWWPQLDSARLRRLEDGDFDIVVLDIQDVCSPELSDTGDGLGVLRRVKAVNPHQVIVAFSGKSYDLGSVPFWRMTDDALRKPVTFIQCKELLDRLISERVSIKSYWDNIRSLLEAQHVPAKKARELEAKLVKAVREGRSLTLDDIRDTVGTIEALGTLVGWIRRLIMLCTAII